MEHTKHRIKSREEMRRSEGAYEKLKISTKERRMRQPAEELHKPRKIRGNQEMQEQSRNEWIHRTMMGTCKDRDTERYTDRKKGVQADRRTESKGKTGTCKQASEKDYQATKQAGPSNQTITLDTQASMPDQDLHANIRMCAPTHTHTKKQTNEEANKQTKKLSD